MDLNILTWSILYVNQLMLGHIHRFLHVQYSRKSPAMYNKHSVGNFGPFVSIADRAEALPEHAKRVSWPEPCLIGGGTKGPENCRECVYTWRGSFGPF